MRWDWSRRRPGRLLGRASLRVRLLALAVCLLAAGAAVIMLVTGRVARGYLMARQDRQLIAYTHHLTSHPFLAAPQVSVDAGRLGTDAGAFSIEVRGRDGQPTLRAGPTGHPGPALRGPLPLGRLTTLPGATGGSYLVIAEPIRYSARHIPFAYNAEDFSLVVTSRSGPGLDGTLIVGLDLASIGRQASALITAGLVTGALALLAVAGLGAMAIRASLRPLARLESTALAIAEGGASSASGGAGLLAPIPAGPAADDPGRLVSPLNSVLARAAPPGPAASVPAGDRPGPLPRAVAEISQELRRPVSVLRGLAEHYRQQGGLPAGERDRILRRVAEEATRIEALAEELRRSLPGPPDSG